VIGLLTLSSHKPEVSFSERDIFLLSTLVDYAAIAIQNARLFESIAESKALMDSVFSSVASGVLTVDPDGRISLINPAGRQILQAPDAAAGACLGDACPAIEAKLRPLIEATRAQDEPTGPLEVDLPLPSGDILHLRMMLSPLRRGAKPSEGVTVVIEDLTRQRKLESRFRLFQRYLSPTVIERLPDDPQELKLGGVRREITCLFADLRGFVDFSVRHPPERLMETLNKYLGLGAEAVLEEEGTLDKFQGDAVVAFFNAPLSQENHVLRAIRVAVKIRDKTRELHTRLGPEHLLEYGVGISVGEAIVGNIGTPQRLDYTAIGPSVNMAKRLQAGAEPGQILITPQVYQRTRDRVTARPLVLRGVKGPEGPIHAYELLDLS
jgi:class 3 adenylate cyclase